MTINLFVTSLLIYLFTRHVTSPHSSRHISFLFTSHVILLDFTFMFNPWSLPNFRHNQLTMFKELGHIQDQKPFAMGKYRPDYHDMMSALHWSLTLLLEDPKSFENYEKNIVRKDAASIEQFKQLTEQRKGVRADGVHLRTTDPLMQHIMATGMNLGYNKQHCTKKNKALIETTVGFIAMSMTTNNWNFPQSEAKGK